jgi:hypothetical protein
MGNMVIDCQDKNVINGNISLNYKNFINPVLPTMLNEMLSFPNKRWLNCHQMSQRTFLPEGPEQKQISAMSLILQVLVQL